MANINAMDMAIDVSTGCVLKPFQPCFYAYMSADATDVTGDSTVWTATLDSTLFNVGTCFNTATYTFTAPCTGSYILGCNVTFKGLPAITDAYVRIVVNGNQIPFVNTNPNGLKTTGGLASCSYIGFIPITVGNTAYLSVKANGSTKTVDISSGTDTYLWGYMLS